MNIDDNTLIAVGSILGPILGWLGYKKVTRDGRVADASAGADEAASKAYEIVIERITRETERMSKVNDALAVKCNDFQLDNIQLRADITLLREQIQKFRETETYLRREIHALQTKVEELTAALKRKCPCGQGTDCETAGDVT